MNKTSRQAVYLFISTLMLLSVFDAQENKAKLSVTVSTDKNSYNPSDRMRVFVNITNDGEQEILTKEIHAKVIAKSWFGMTAHSESKSFSRNFNVNKSRFGYVEVPIPWYTPIGRYGIQVWTTYGSPDEKRQVVENSDLESDVGEAEIEVNIGVVFLLFAFGTGGISLYIISTISGRKPLSYRPTKSIKHDATKLTDVRVEYAIIISLILCIAISLVYVGLSKREKETFSALYIKPDSYSNYVKDNTFSLVYGVECYEKYPTEYPVMFYLGDRLIDNDKLELCNAGPRSIRKMENKKVLNIPSDTKYPVRLRIILKSYDREYENIIWIRGIKKEVDEV